MHEISAETGLLSPHDVAGLLGKGEGSTEEAFARLDVGACRFGSQVNDRGEKPCAVTGFAGFGDPVAGALVFSSSGIDALHARGEKAILALEATTSKFTISLDFNPDGRICICEDSFNEHAEINSHVLGEASKSGSVLFDNPGHPRFRWHKGEQFISLEDGSRLCEGDKITIDPIHGCIWRGILPPSPPPDYVEALQDAAQDLTRRHGGSVVGCCVSSFQELAYLNDLSEKIPSLYGTIGLFRTENGLRRHCSGTGNIFFKVLKGYDLAALQYWEAESLNFTYPMFYRLADLHGLSDFLPDSIAEEFKKDLDHCEGTDAFKLREQLYRLQLRNAFGASCFEEVYKSFPKAIIIPAVATKDEARFFRRLVMGEAWKRKLSDVVFFGVMGELKEALNNIAEIAPLCDVWCFGTNDLTASITSKSRGDLSYPGWTALVPEVIEPMAAAIVTARQANPNIWINWVGYQTGDIASLDAVLAMGVNQITVPAEYASVRRTQFAIARHVARQAVRSRQFPSLMTPPSCG